MLFNTNPFSGIGVEEDAEEQQFLDGNQFDRLNKDWTQLDPANWKATSSYVKETYGFTTETQYRSRVDWAAWKFKNEQGRWPSSSELVAYAPFQQTLNNLAWGLPTELPQTFRVGTQNYYNDPFEGPVPEAQYLGPLAQYADERRVGATFDTWDDLVARLQASRATARGGGGGGGAVGRAARTFDRAQLLEAATDRWKGIMFEDPDDATIGSAVDAYMNRANAFWMGQGGDLDFDTFLLGKMRDTARYKLLYARKDQHLTEEEWMGRYRGTVEQYGLNEQATRRETEAGLMSGAGLSGFNERVSRTAEARNADGGRFSQRLASQMQQMGALG